MLAWARNNLVSLVSWTLGLLDQSYSLLIFVLGEKRPKFFRDGWQDSFVQSLRSRDSLLQRLDQHGRKTSFYPIADSITWKPLASSSLPSTDSVKVTEGRFPSPLADRLPSVAKECQFFLVEPSTATNTNKDTETKANVVVIMLPATGEGSKKARLATATQLARQHGWTSVIVTAPFYAARKPSDQKLWFVNNVNDFLHQSEAIMEEAAALACHYLEQDTSTRVCLTGFSWGGAMASCASCIAMLSGADTTRLACVPYVGCPTPAVLPDGLLQSSIDWEALKDPKNKTESKESTRARLSKHLCEFDLVIFTDMVEKHQSSNESKTRPDVAPLGALNVVAMKHDHIIPLSWSQDLIAQMSKMTRPREGQVLSNTSSSILPTKWIPGGHVFALLIKPRVQTQAIVEAVHALAN